jgi:hypothetical protein
VREFVMTTERPDGRGRGSGESEGKKERWRRELGSASADAAC